MIYLLNNGVFRGSLKNITKKYLDSSKDYNKNDEFLSDRVEKIKKFLKEEKKNVWSQLSKYYVYALNQLYDQYNGVMEAIDKHIYCYLLSPDYRRFEFTEVDEKNKIISILYTKYCCSNKYQVLYYNDIFKYFAKSELNDDELKNNLRYLDFKGMLEILKRDSDDMLEREMYNKLYRIACK